MDPQCECNNTAIPGPNACNVLYTYIIGGFSIFYYSTEHTHSYTLSHSTKPRGSGISTTARTYSVAAL